MAEYWTDDKGVKNDYRKFGITPLTAEEEREGSEAVLGMVMDRFAALEVVAAAARALLRRAEGISPDDPLDSVLSLIEWVEWPGLRDALDVLGSEK